jgi:hypothetical protein
MAEIVQTCGCVVIWSRGKPLNSQIKYCPKHAAAPALYEALAEMVDRVEKGGVIGLDMDEDIIDESRAALALTNGDDHETQ